MTMACRGAAAAAATTSAAEADASGARTTPAGGAAAPGEADRARARAHSGEFNEWQRRWWWQVARKTLVWSAALVALLNVVLAQSEDAALPAPGPEALRRAWLSVLGAALAWLTLYLTVVRSEPPEQGDVKLHLLAGGATGHYAYFTFWIVSLFAAYWSACAAGELLWALGHAQGEGFAWSRKLLRAAYAGSSLVAALGVALGAIFLRFNWFEPRWRETVLERYRARGRRLFGAKALFTHLNQTPLALLDVGLVKHRGMLEEHTAGLAAAAAALVLLALLYTASIHLNFRLSGCYPYPFLHKVMLSWRSEAAFVAAIVLFAGALTLLMRRLALAPPWIEL